MVLKCTSTLVFFSTYVSNKLLYSTAVWADSRILALSRMLFFMTGSSIHISQRLVIAISNFSRRRGVRMFHEFMGSEYLGYLCSHCSSFCEIHKIVLNVCVLMMLLVSCIYWAVLPDLSLCCFMTLEISVIVFQLLLWQRGNCCLNYQYFLEIKTATQIFAHNEICSRH